MTRLRLAEEADIPTLVEMGAEMIAASSFAAMPYSPEKTAESIRRDIEHAFAAVSVEGDIITGVILGDVVQPWYSEQRMAVDYVLYVRPQYRGTRAAVMLVKAWAAWAVDSGAKQLRPGVSTGDPQAERLYEALGFRRVGAVFMMDVPDDARNTDG